MIRGIDANGADVLPDPHAEAVCPECGGELVPKCGAIVDWHFAHAAESSPGCTLRELHAGGGESRWHRRWKLRLARAGFRVEHAHERDGQRRIADAELAGCVVEVQARELMPDELRAREEFWGPGLVWIVPAGKRAGLSRWSDRSSATLAVRTTFVRRLTRASRPTVIDAGELGIYLAGAWSRHEKVTDEVMHEVRAWYEARVVEQFTPDKLVNRLARRAAFYGPDAWHLAPSRDLFMNAAGWARMAERRSA